MTLEIKQIETKPEHDLYVNLEGHVSRTVLWLRPEDRTCGVVQEYRTNSTTMDRWHNRELFWYVPDHPLESNMRRWIEENMGTLERICDGHIIEWDGNNHVGNLTEEARDLQYAIEQELEMGVLGNHYNYWTVDSWLEHSRDEVTADMTDDELEKLADEWQGTGEDVVIGDILDFITKIRDTLRYEKELELVEDE